MLGRTNIGGSGGLVTLNGEPIITAVNLVSKSETVSSLSMSTLPYEFYNGSAVVYNGEIHIFGSQYSDHYTKHYKWDGSSWASVSTLPYNFYSGSAVVYNNEIHILGGYGGCDSHYKWNGSSWSKVSKLPYYFGGGSAVVYNNEIHILGGCYYSGTKTKHYKWNGSSWSEVSTLPYDFCAGSSVVYNNEIHILGGNYYSGSNKDKHYKWAGSSWTSVSTLPYPFINSVQADELNQYGSASSVVYNNEIHILGNGNGNTSHYKWNGSSWTSASTLPYEFRAGSAIVYNNEIHILGSYEISYRTSHYISTSSSYDKLYMPI